MIKADQIPDEVVQTAREAWLRSDVNAIEDWRVAIAAALNAWPGIVTKGEVEVNASGGLNGYYLPLPEAPEGRIAERMEASDE